MRMQDMASWDSLTKSSGELSDQHVQRPPDERKAVRKRTFTRWMNFFLHSCDPPIEVHDLFVDIQDGRILMGLLEELSGCKLLYRFRSSSHHIFRLNNISKALAFLDDRHVKLFGIDASGIADGIPSVVLNLVWNIILHFQVKEVTRGLQRHLSSSLSSLSMSSYPSSSDLSPQPNDIGSFSCNTLPSKGRKAAREPKYQGRAIKTLLQWVQRRTSKFGVEVHDFGKSWRNGLAFLALIKSINPNLVDLRESLFREPKENIQQAFLIAHHSLDIAPLLEPEDVMCPSPDEKSIITYVSLFLGCCSGKEEDHSTDIKVPEIPNFGSIESVTFGENLSDNAEAQDLLRGFEKSSEQLLWKQWSISALGSPRATSLHTSETLTSNLSSSDGDIFSSCRSQGISEQSAGGAAASPFNKKKGRCRSILQPPSPLDAGIVSQDIRAWMEKDSVQVYSKPRADESHFSLSSEEGIYSLSALDSDEEDAYSYILDLNKEVFNQLKRQVPRVEEETVEELIEEEKHPEACEIINGREYKPQEGPLVQNESGFREMRNNGTVFDMEPEDESSRKEEPEEDCGDGKWEKEGVKNFTLVTHGIDKTEALVDEAEEAKIFKMPSRQKEADEGIDRGLSVKCVLESEKRGNMLKEERENQHRVLTSEGFEVRVNHKILTHEAGYEVRGSADRIHTDKENDGKDAFPKMEALTKKWKNEDTEEYTHEVITVMHFEAASTVKEENSGLKMKKHKLTETKAKTIDRPEITTTKNHTDAGINIHAADNTRTSACQPTSQSLSSEGGFILQSLEASCDITPLELQVLLVLWFLLYCCLILPQMNLGGPLQ